MEGQDHPISEACARNGSHLLTARARSLEAGGIHQAREGDLRWEHWRKVLLVLLRLRSRRIRLRAWAWLDRSSICHPCLLLASDKGIEGGVGMNDLGAVGALLTQARGLRRTARHVILEGSCRSRVRRGGGTCLAEAVDAGAGGSVAGFPTRQACRVGEKVNRPYHGDGTQWQRIREDRPLKGVEDCLAWWAVVDSSCRWGWCWFPHGKAGWRLPDLHLPWTT